MGQYKKVISGLLIAVAVSVFGLSAAQAASEFKAGDEVATTQSKTIDGSLYIAGNNVTIKGIVNGDVFCAGQNVTVNAIVKGDVLCAGQNVRLEGVVEGDARLAGQNVTLVGEVKKNATLAGQVLNLEKSGKVGQDVTVTGNRLTLAGSIGRDAIINSDKVRIDGKVGRDTIREKFDASSTTDSRNQFSLFSVWFYTVLALLLVSLMLAFIFPRQLKNAGERVDNHPLSTFLTGLVASLIVPIIIALLFVTIIGIPLALLLLLVWIVILFLSGPIAGYAIGKLLLRGRAGVVATALIGGLALITLYFVPFLGLLIILFVPCFGIGSILIELYRRTGDRIAPSSQRMKKKK